MRNNFLTIGQKVRYLMECHGIKNAPELAKAMYEKGIIQYPDKMRSSTGSEVTEKECQRYIARTINNHLLNETDVKAEWIKNYCDFFGCSADFLLGYISMPSHDVSSVHDQTGLSEKAIKILQNMNERNRSTGSSETLSHLIEDPDFPFLLRSLKAKADGYIEPYIWTGNAIFRPKKQTIINYETESTFRGIMERVRERRLTTPEAVMILYEHAYAFYDDGRLTKDQLDYLIQQYDSGNYLADPDSIKSDVSEDQ